MNKEVTIDIENPKDNDLISRQAVLDLAKKGVLISNGNYESVCKAINEIPSVNPIKTGHWIKKDGYSDCSECGSHIVTEWDYCPKCGAKMIEPQERRSGEE